jgi:hypothetical protein
MLLLLLLLWLLQGWPAEVQHSATCAGNERQRVAHPLPYRTTGAQLKHTHSTCMDHVQLSVTTGEYQQLSVNTHA